MAPRALNGTVQPVSRAKAVGAGASDPSPADRQPERNSLNSSLGPPGKGASSPTAGMAWVIRWRLPTTNTRPSRTHTAVDTPLGPERTKSTRPWRTVVTAERRSPERSRFWKACTRTRPWVMSARSSLSEVWRTAFSRRRRATSGPMRARFQVQADTAAAGPGGPGGEHAAQEVDDRHDQQDGHQPDQGRPGRSRRAPSAAGGVRSGGRGRCRGAGPAGRPRGGRGPAGPRPPGRRPRGRASRGRGPRRR